MRLAAAILSASFLGAQQLPIEPLHDSGQGITGAYEGWFRNPDGSFNLLFGYYNRNTKESVDIPVGPNNRMEPGGPDRGQPTHFLPRRQWGVFTVTVPKDFGDQQKITWTLVANGKPTEVPASLNPLWELSPFVDATNNTPPYIGFQEAGPFVQGPKGHGTMLTTTLSDPVELKLWVADDAAISAGAARPRSPVVTLSWSKFRGPGEVTFEHARPAVQSMEFAKPPNAVFGGKATTTATFSEPGEYILRVVANDWSGDGGRGFQCCWTNAQVKVMVRAAASSR
jgi:hypothetical protein